MPQGSGLHTFEQKIITTSADNMEIIASGKKNFKRLSSKYKPGLGSTVSTNP